MKILVVIDDYFNKSNGMCISTQRFVHQFKKANNDVRVVSTAIGGIPYYPMKEMIVPFFKNIISKEGFHLAIPNKKQLIQAINWADIVLIETPFPLSWTSAKIARKKFKPVVGTFHILPGNITEPVHINNWFFNNFFMYFFKYISFKNCTAIQCPTPKVKNILKKYKFKPQLYVVSNGITKAFIDNPHKSYIGHPFTIICIGRLSREKHQETLLQALKLSHYAKNFKIVFAGKGPLEAKYKAWAQKLDLNIDFKFFTPSDLRKTLTNCDLVVHCADVEVEGMACMEAFAAGCVPVIANSPLSSTSSYALSQENIFPAHQPIQLANRLDYWYTHPCQLKQMQRKYRHYAKSLSVQKSAQKVLAELKILLKKYNP